MAKNLTRNVLQHRKLDRKKFKTSPQSLSSEPTLPTKNEELFIEERGYFKQLQACSRPSSSESVLFTMSPGASYNFSDKNIDFERKVHTKRIRKGRQSSSESIPVIITKEVKASKASSYDFLEEAGGVETRKFETKKFPTNLQSESVLFSEPEKNSNKDSKTSEFETEQRKMRSLSQSSEPVIRSTYYDSLEEEDDFEPREIRRKWSQTKAQSRPSDSVLFALNDEALYNPSQEENRRPRESRTTQTEKSSHSQSPYPAQFTMNTSYDFLAEKEDSEHLIVKTKGIETYAQSSSSNSALFTKNERAFCNAFEEKDSRLREDRTDKSSTNLTSPSSKSVKSRKSKKSSRSLPKFATVEDVLRYLAGNAKIDVQLYVPIFAAIDELVKQRKTQLSTQDILQNKEVEKLSRNVQKNLNSLKTEDALALVKVLTNLGISINSLLCYDLIKILLKNINKLPLQSLLFLDRFIASHSQAVSNPLLGAFKVAVPMVFETLIKSHVNECDIDTLFYAVAFATSQNSISNETRQMLVDQLLKRMDQIGLVHACKMIKELPRTRKSLFHTWPLLKELQNRIEGHLAKLSSRKLIGVVSDSIARFSFIHDRSFLDFNFIEQATNELIRRKEFLSCRDAGWLLRKLNYVNYYCPELLDRVDELFKKSPSLSTEHVFTYVRACSINMYKPRHWNSYEDRMLMRVDSLETIASLRLVIDLLVLQCCPHKFVARCFEEPFLNRCSREDNPQKKAILRLQRIHEIIKVFRTSVFPGPFLPDHFVDEAVAIQRERKSSEYHLLNQSLLQYLGGQEYVLNGVRTELGHVVDHLIVKCKSGKMYPVNPEKITGDCNLSYESLNLPRDSRSIAVLPVTHGAFCNLSDSRLTGSYQIGLRCLEAQGIVTIPISRWQWLNLRGEEKVPYLMNKMNSTFLHNVNLKKSGS